LYSATKMGAIGEHIAASVILGFDGWSVGHVPQDGFDLIAFDDIGALRIQVKSGGLRVNESYRSPSYHFNNGSGGKKRLRVNEYDILCHCATDVRRCVFYASNTVNKVSQRYPQSYFDNINKEQDTWLRAVEIFREGFC
jgi:hypothetical protein